MFKLQSPSQDSPFDAIHLLRYFFHCSKLFLNSLILMSFSVLAIFLFYLFHMGKMFPFEDFFMAGGGGRGINRSHSGWRGRVGYGGHAVFSQKLQNTQRGVGRCTCKSPIMKWANMLKESSKKKITEVERSLSQQHQLVHSYRWVSRTLTWEGEACTIWGLPSRR